MTSDLTHAQQHELEHQAIPSDPALRVKALESLLRPPTRPALRDPPTPSPPQANRSWQVRSTNQNSMPSTKQFYYTGFPGVAILPSLSP